MAKDVFIIPKSGSIDFKDSSVIQANIYESNGDLYVDSISGSVIIGNGTSSDRKSVV